MDKVAVCERCGSSQCLASGPTCREDPQGRKVQRGATMIDRSKWERNVEAKKGGRR